MLRNIAPLAAYKFSDESITSTTLQNDDALVVQLAANAVYAFTCVLFFQGGTGGSSDIQWKWVLPANATMGYHRISIDNTGANTVGAVSTQASNPAAESAGAGNTRSVLMAGSVANSNMAGPMQLQWAQHAPSATATIVKTGSILTLAQVA